MKTPGPSTPGGGDGAFNIVERDCLEMMLELQLSPCLVAETQTARAMLLNEDARQILHDGTPGETRSRIPVPTTPWAIGSGLKRSSLMCSAASLAPEGWN